MILRELDPGPTADERLMLTAADLAAGRKGYTAPNPCVGALLAKASEIVAQGRHERYGLAHAEVACLADARAKGVDPGECDLYVTLEPCNHHGKTPPCTQAVLEAGIKRVVIGALDPNPHVDGGGADFLRRQGVAVATGVAERECRDLIADFLVWSMTDRPYVYGKLAATLDGKIACRTGHSQWISGPESRKAVHELRARVGAVLVGGGTFRADNPDLSARQVEPIHGRQPLAVAVTTQLPQPGTHTLTGERAAQTIFWTDEQSAEGAAADALREAGCRVWGLPSFNDDLDIFAGLKRLRAEAGVLDVLCEGGGATALRFLNRGLMDELWLFSAPSIIGDAAAPGLLTGRAPQTMDEALRLRLCEVAASGDDVKLVYRPREDGCSPD